MIEKIEKENKNKVVTQTFNGGYKRKMNTDKR